jgi:hypothetical protein
VLDEEITPHRKKSGYYEMLQGALERISGGSYELGNELSGSIKGGELFD